MTSSLKSLKAQLCTLLICGLSNGAVLAAADDFNAPIEIEAQQVQVNGQAGTSTYQGKVRLKRGSMLIEAHKMVLKQRDNQVSAEIDGGLNTQATFSQLTATGERMEAKARRIRYFSDQDAIEFDGDAEVKRAADKVNSDHIRYDLRAEQILAGESEGTGRVRIVIQPAAHKEKAQDKP